MKIIKKNIQRRKSGEQALIKLLIFILIILKSKWDF